MKTNAKIIAIIRAMANADGGYSYACRDIHTDPEDLDERFWVNLMWLDDWFKAKKGTYYLGFNQKTDSYVVEWRGHVKASDGTKTFERQQVVDGPSCGYLFDTAELILQGIKHHKRYLKEEVKRS